MKRNGPPSPNEEPLTAVIPPTPSSQTFADPPARHDDAISAPPVAVTEPVPAVSTEPFSALPQTSVFDAAPYQEIPPPTAATVQSVITAPRPRSQVPRWTKVIAATALVFAVLTLVLLLSARQEGRATTDRPQDDLTTVPSSTTPSSTSIAGPAPVASTAALTESTETVAPSTNPPRSTIAATSAATTTSAPSTVTRTTVPQVPTSTIATTTSTTAIPTTTATPSTTTPTTVSSRPT